MPQRNTKRTKKHQNKKGNPNNNNNNNKNNNNKPIKQANENKKFVTNFTMVMQRFPEYYGADLSPGDREIVYDFFARVARFTEKTFDDFNPSHLLLAFMLVNFPDETLLGCMCNPFRHSLLYRSVNFVGAVFQVVVDCKSDEDDGSDDFLPLFTAKNYLHSMIRFNETLHMFNAYFNSKMCRCEAGHPTENHSTKTLF